MPLYEYQCDACAHRFERIQKFSDPPIETCPSCGGTVKKLLSSPAIQFKGSGWYITDYAKKGSKDGKGSPSTTGSGGDSASTTTTTTAGTDAAKTSGGTSDSKS
jgi:putative FmdB family regulatory protein